MPAARSQAESDMKVLEDREAADPARLMKTPRSVDIDITSHCNLRCSYCYHFSGPGDVKQDLPYEEWALFFKELRRCAVLSVTLAGGEPFVRQDIRELLSAIAANKMRFSILSNGTLLNDEHAAFLAASGRCDGVQISIDGATAASHDSCRGTGSFVRAVNGIACLQRHGVSVNVRVTIHRHNVAELSRIADFLLEELGLPSFSTNAASYLGTCIQNNDQIALSLEDRMLAMATLVLLAEKYDQRITATAGPLAEAVMWSEMERAYLAGEKSLAGGGHLTGCGCVMSSIAVRADGVIVPCTMLSHIELGKINEDSLEELWQHHPEMIRMRQRSFVSLASFSPCKECVYCSYCTGNCPGLAYSFTGKVQSPSPDACYHAFLQKGGRLPFRVGECL